jgi:predicted nuclease with TOPRIM domain
MVVSRSESSQRQEETEASQHENKELAAKVDRLREKLKAAEKEKAELETSQCNAVIQLI